VVVALAVLLLCAFTRCCCDCLDCESRIKAPDVDDVQPAKRLAVRDVPGSTREWGASPEAAAEGPRESARDAGSEYV
jgi:hypothetical protein